MLVWLMCATHTHLSSPPITQMREKDNDRVVIGYVFIERKFLIVKPHIHVLMAA